jgi:hypothetical protein
VTPVQVPVPTAGAGGRRVTGSPRLGAAPLEPLVLPRAEALTDLLLGAGPRRPSSAPDTAAPGPRGSGGRGTAVPTGAPDAAAIAARVDDGLGAAVAGRPAGSTRCLRIGTYQLARPVAPSGGAGRVGGEPPFRWTARTARRTIGVAAVRTLLSDGGTPADAVRAVLAHPGAELCGSTPPPGSCAEWLAALTAAARALVGAEATTWATQLWTALDWERLAPSLPEVGAPDRWWGWQGPVRVALRGRADVRLTRGGGAHLLVLPGHPHPASRTALCLSALVDVLARGTAEAPRRVVGFWPDSGKAWAVAVDAGVLSTVAGAVGHAVEGLLRADPLASGVARR